ncbi:enolase C-terminal domain-like protein [Mesorhizobium shangrilense]|uniref:Enolase C-terminal domain-like protein n=1 Tax=Mesorhizobium shangrilense TaxID=460060 RepID=A0ABV2DSE7_9HYPH
MSLAAFLTPESHSTCRPVGASVLGQRLESPADIADITRRVWQDSMNVLQAPHIYSGVEMALWDLLGKRYEEPVYRLLGYDKAFAKQPYVVVPFAAVPEQTFERMRHIRQAGYRAVKTGWSGFGHGNIASDLSQLAAAREGLGADARLFIDAARIWGCDVVAAKRYCPLFDQFSIEWVEEPFDPTALNAYADFAAHHGRMRLAAGENIHSIQQAQQLLNIAGIGVIQIDCGRVGGIGAAKEIAQYADLRCARYINHTYTSHLALSASLQAYAGLERQDLCEYPMDPTSLSWSICREHLLVGGDGEVTIPNAPGLGITISLDDLQRYVVDLEIRIGRTTLYRTPSIR